ncbi:hypothetical protein OF83DRAFT_154278 [Amylostereum chailletii]|nr:hypothetical protein OF83DRAFT_154278 [Amylostereum chailletii]
MSASMLDYYDAQMFDYSGDADVHMHTTFPSPKAWLQTEAPMDDDIEPLSTEPIHSLLQDVEVDMEPAYTDGVEYDMLDDVSGDGGGTESVDVDFVDAEHDGEPQHEPSSDFQQGSIPLEPLSETHAAPEPLAQHTESLHSPLAGSSIGGEIPQPILEELSRFTSVPDNVDSDGVPDEAPSHADTVDGAYIDQLDEVRPEPFDGPSEGAQAGVDPSEGEGEPSVAHEDHTVPDLVPDHDSFPGASSDVPFIEPEHPLADNGPSVPDEEVSGHSIEGSGDRSRPEHEPYFDENREDGDDPHEITDGIYIDPPPPVLIDLPNLSSSEKAEYCLFSHPFDGTSGSPREMASTSAISHFSILLHHQPALYYERLPEVFDALRQEEQTQHLIDFAEGELVIDAYDLQLEISEVSECIHCCVTFLTCAP